MNYTDYLTNADFIDWVNENYRSNFNLVNKIDIYTKRYIQKMNGPSIGKSIGKCKEHVYDSLKTFELCVDRYVDFLNGKHETTGQDRALWRNLSSADILMLPTSYSSAKPGEYYFTGELCINKHRAVRVRYANTGQCVRCQEAKSKAWNKARLVKDCDRLRKPKVAKVEVDKPEQNYRTVTVLGIKMRVGEKI
jgi:hypothetical protein